MSRPLENPFREPIAVVGMAGLFPMAPDIGAFWENILGKVDAVGDPPASRDMDSYVRAGEKTGLYCVRGGYIGDDARFHPKRFGVMPSAVDGAEPEQFMALELAHETLLDAGFPEIPLNRDRTEVILGRGTFVNRGTLTQFQHSIALDQFIGLLRQLHPEHTDAELESIRDQLKAGLPPTTPETAGGNSSSLVSGRVANRFDLRGVNYTIDAACASSLIAVEHALKDLRGRRCDAVLAGGIQISTTVPIHNVFCHLGALSRSRKLRPFDEQADGTMLGEGAGMMLLKRLEDAERDGNRIYALVRAVGTSSDGRAKAVLTPRVEGQELALRRAYEEAGVSPETVELIEAHGTGMPVGDETEMRALRQVFGERRGRPTCAIGSVKSMISHLLPAAGAAGMIKAILALHHKVLPPTLNCDRPNPKLEIDRTVFYLNTSSRPWVHGSAEPRRAGVNAFGFGGINAHALLEEYHGREELQHPSLQRTRENEVVILRGESRAAVLAEARGLRAYLAGSPEVPLGNVAATLNTDLQDGGLRLAMVAADTPDLAAKLDQAIERLEAPDCTRIGGRGGIHYNEAPLAAEGGLAFLFPGEGSQYPGMLADLCMHFPAVRSRFDLMDRAFVDHPRGYRPSEFIFPPAEPGSESGAAAADDKLWQMDGAVEAVFVGSQALHGLLGSLGVKPDALLGHSQGEFSALLAAGAIRIESDAALVEMIRRVNGVYERLARSQGVPRASLVAVGGADPADVEEALRDAGGDLFLAVDNCRYQIVLCGSPRAAERATEMLRTRGAICTSLPFDRPYHTPLFEPASAILEELFPAVEAPSAVPALWSCSTAAPYPGTAAGARRAAMEQWIRPVRFRETIQAMYAAGVRIFVEVGPRANLTSFVKDVLGKRPALAVASNVASRSGLSQLHHLIAQLAAHGVSLRLGPLYASRACERLDLSAAGGRVAAQAEASVPIRLSLPRLELPGGARVDRPSEGPSARAPAPEAPAPAARPVRDADEAVLNAHFGTMRRFLETQREVFTAFLAGEAPALEAAAAASAPPADLPLVGEVRALDAGVAAETRRRFDVESDRFLLDHAFGGAVSTTDPALTALPVMPLAMMMEMAAETAALIFPGRALVGLRDVRALRWVSFEDGEATLEARAASTGPDAARVVVREAAGGAPAPLLECTALFADRLPPGPPLAPFQPEAGVPSSWNASRVYRDGSIHGPAFQGVERVETWGRDGLVARLRALAWDGLFAGNPRPEFLIDPLLVDSALQLQSFWNAEHDPRGFNTLPFAIGSLETFSGRPSAGTALVCRARIRRASDVQLRADMEIAGENDRVLLRMTACDNRAFDLPEQICALTSSSRGVRLSEPWRAPTERLRPAEAFRCRRLSAGSGSMWEGHGLIFQKGFAHLVLGRAEREAWRSLRRKGRGRTEWLLGRAAVKDAVCELLHDRYGLDLLPADIEISQDALGRPRAGGPWMSDVAHPLAISIAHSRGTAVGLAVDGELGVETGIDIEVMRSLEPGFDEVAFTEEERGLLELFPGDLRDEWRLRGWCAKEAAAKALGSGLGGKPRDLVLRKIDEVTGAASIEIAGSSVPGREGWKGSSLEVITLREGDFVAAISNRARSNS